MTGMLYEYGYTVLRPGVCAVRVHESEPTPADPPPPWWFRVVVRAGRALGLIR